MATESNRLIGGASMIPFSQAFAPTGPASMLRGPSIPHAPEDDAGAGGDAVAAGGGGAASLLFDGGGDDVEAVAGADAAKDAGKGGGSSFLDAIDDPDLKAWAENKKFPGVKEALESQRNLEKLLGGEKLPAPKDENDTEGRLRLQKALGLPDSPEGYDFSSLGDTVDPDFAKAMAPVLLAAGVSKVDAPKLAEGWNKFVEAQTAAMQAAFDGQSQADLGALKTEWASDFPANIEHSRRAARVLGLQPNEAKAIELELGTKRFLTMFAKIGQGIGEGEFIEGNGGGKSFKLTPDQAKARIALLQKDAAWQTRYLNGGADEKAEWDRLHMIVAPKAA